MATRLTLLCSFDSTSEIFWHLNSVQMSQNFSDVKSVKSCVRPGPNLPGNKNFGCLSSCRSLLRGSRPKSAKARPQQFTHTVPGALLTQAVKSVQCTPGPCSDGPLFGSGNFYWQFQICHWRNYTTPATVLIYVQYQLFLLTFVNPVFITSPQ